MDLIDQIVSIITEDPDTFNITEGKQISILPGGKVLKKNPEDPERLFKQTRRLERLSKLGFNTPKIIEIGDDYVVHEYIKGPTLKEIKPNLTNIQKEKLLELQKKQLELGIYIGDLNHNNIIWNNNEWFIIDVGAIRKKKDLPHALKRQVKRKWKINLKEHKEILTEDEDNIATADLEEIAKDPRLSYLYAEELGFKNVPEIIIQGIAKNSHYAYLYAEELGFKNVPEIIIQGIAKNSHYAYLYARGLEFKNVPEIIIQGIAKDPDQSYIYAEDLGFKNVPEIIVQGIAQDSLRSYGYARGLRFKNIPKIIIQGIAKDPDQSYKYAIELDFKNIPEIIIQSIAKNSTYSYNYAKKLGFKNVPEIIIRGIAKDSRHAYMYAEKLEFKNIPEIIIQGIAKDPIYSYDYAEELGFKNIPEIIIQSMAKHDEKLTGTIQFILQLPDVSKIDNILIYIYDKSGYYFSDKNFVLTKKTLRTIANNLNTINQWEIYPNKLTPLLHSAIKNKVKIPQQYWENPHHLIEYLNSLGIETETGTRTRKDPEAEAKYRTLDRYAQKNREWAIKKYPLEYERGTRLAPLFKEILDALENIEGPLVIHGRDSEMVFQLAKRLRPHLYKRMIYILTSRPITTQASKVDPKFKAYLERLLPKDLDAVHVDTGFKGSIPEWFKKEGWNVKDIKLISSDKAEYAMLDKSYMNQELRDVVLSDLEHSSQRLSTAYEGIWGNWSYDKDAPGFWSRLYGIIDNFENGKSLKESYMPFYVSLMVESNPI